MSLGFIISNCIYYINRKISENFEKKIEINEDLNTI
jgi:hypothetical protein